MRVGCLVGRQLEESANCFRKRGGRQSQRLRDLCLSPLAVRISPGPGDFSRESNVDLSFDVPPLFRLSEDTYEFLKHVDIRWSIFEPRKEIEGFAEIATVVEATRDCWEVFQADPDVSRSGFEYRTSFTLAKLPPGFRLRDGIRAARVASGLPRAGW